MKNLFRCDWCHFQAHSADNMRLHEMGCRDKYLAEAADGIIHRLIGDRLEPSTPMDDAARRDILTKVRARVDFGTGALIDPSCSKCGAQPCQRGCCG